MKFNLGETTKERKIRLSNWHSWFAWFPVQVADHDMRWLEAVQRRVEMVNCCKSYSIYKAMEAE